MFCVLCFVLCWNVCYSLHSMVYYSATLTQKIKKGSKVHFEIDFKYFRYFSWNLECYTCIIFCLLHAYLLKE